MFSITASLVLEHHRFTAHVVVLRADGTVRCEACARTWIIPPKERSTALPLLARKLGIAVVVPLDEVRPPSARPEAAE